MRTFLLAALMVASASVWAEWVRWDESDNAVFYYDSKTIIRDGNLRRVWRLDDFKQRNKDGELSFRALVEYDCTEKRRRILSRSTHSESMARGKILFSPDGVSEWGYIPPGSISERLLKIVCR